MFHNEKPKWLRCLKVVKSLNLLIKIGENKTDDPEALSGALVISFDAIHCQIYRSCVG